MTPKYKCFVLRPEYPNGIVANHTERAEVFYLWRCFPNAALYTASLSFSLGCGFFAVAMLIKGVI